MSPPLTRRELGAKSQTPFTSLTAAFRWIVRFGASGAEENARRAVASISRADAVVAELDERAQRNGWAQRVQLGTAFVADGQDAFVDEDEAEDASISRSA